MKQEELRCFSVFCNPRLIYESIYNFWHDENDIVSLTLDVDGNTAYEAFLVKITETLNRQWEDQQEYVDVSKDDRDVLRLAAVLHVFYDQLQKGLTNQPTSPPQALVKKQTLEQAINLTRYFAEQRKILVRYVQGNVKIVLQRADFTLTLSTMGVNINTGITVEPVF